MASLTKSDVLAVLAESVTQSMDFYVSTVSIKGLGFTCVADKIRSGEIGVFEGRKNLAFYNDALDVITTMKGTSPGTLSQRAQLLHECTHALIDILHPKGVTRHVDELSSYIVQEVYSSRTQPNRPMGTNSDPKWDAFFKGVASLVKSCGLDKATGNGAKITLKQIEPLRVMLAGLPGVNYGNFDKDDPSGADGILPYTPGARTVRQGFSS